MSGTISASSLPGGIDIENCSFVTLRLRFTDGRILTLDILPDLESKEMYMAAGSILYEGPIPQTKAELIEWFGNTIAKLLAEDGSE